MSSVEGVDGSLDRQSIAIWQSIVCIVGIKPRQTRPTCRPKPTISDKPDPEVGALGPSFYRLHKDTPPGPGIRLASRRARPSV